MHVYYVTAVERFQGSKHAKYVTCVSTLNEFSCTTAGIGTGPPSFATLSLKPEINEQYVSHHACMSTTMTIFLQKFENATDKTFHAILLICIKFGLTCPTLKMFHFNLLQERELKFLPFKMTFSLKFVYNQQKRMKLKCFEFIQMFQLIQK